MSKQKNLFHEKELKIKVQDEIKRCFNFEMIVDRFKYDADVRAKEIFEGGDPEKKIVE